MMVRREKSALRKTCVNYNGLAVAAARAGDHNRLAVGNYGRPA